MGSCNSEHSASMNSEEFSNFIGHNYAAPVLPLDNIYPQFVVEAESLNSIEAMDPAATSSGASHAPAIFGNIAKPSVKNTNDDTSNVPKKITCSSIINKSVIDPTPGTATCDSVISYNKDGTASVKFSREYMVQAQKQWQTSIIGHFIGGNFAFKFIHDQAHRIWSNKGLTGVYYSSKGYYTFRFGTMEDRNLALNLNTVQMGGKTLYLLPWMEGSKFKRNVVDKVPCWIRLVDVPYSLWSKDSLTAIARVVGKPLKFDDATARFEPLKYANVQVELAYSSPGPDYVWVTILNAEGVEEQERVEVQYPQLPYSCSLCKAFGHSLARCINNPERVAKRQKMAQDGNQGGTSVNPTKVDYLKNMELVPYTIRKFCGCDVVMDEDEIINEIQKENDSREVGEYRTDAVDQEDNLEEFDKVPGDNSAQIILADPVNVENGFEALSDFAEDLLPIAMSPEMKRNVSPMQRKNSKRHSEVASHSMLVVDLGINTPKPPAKSERDGDGFTKVTNKRGSRSTILKRLQ